jgi:hypothetical protein
MDIQEKKKFIDRIDANFETEIEYRQILKIFQKHKVKITENTHGCFIDLSKINNKTLYKELETIITSCEQSKQYLQQSTKAYNDAIRKN